MTLRLGWFSTGRGQGSYGMLQRVLHAIDAGELDAQVQFVFSNRERGEGEGSDQFFDLIESRDIPLLSYSFRKFRQAHGGQFDPHRAEYDAQVLKLLSPFTPDLCILAGYLLIMSPALSRAFIYLNMHPALPGGPKGLWQSVIWDLIAHRAAETGAMVFHVTEVVDEGPPITFTRFSIRGPQFDEHWALPAGQQVEGLQARYGEDHPLFQAIRQQGVRREPLLLLETIKAFAKGELLVHEGKVVDGHRRPILARDLTQQVEAALARGA